MHARFTSRISRSVPLFMLGLMAPLPCLGQTLYNFGNPTAEEQQYLEYINRARANPTAEGLLLANTKDADVLGAYNYAPNWTVDLTMMKNEFSLLAAAPPLAPNTKLMETSRSHSAWMLENAIQRHDEGSVTFSDRFRNAGYLSAFAAENVAAYSKSIWFGHAGFEVDWGPDVYGRMSGGMQGPPRGHRVNIHNANYREIGIGCVTGSKTGSEGTVGPQLVTQDFGTQTSSPSFGSGVAYYDLNSNDFYDMGEGISGLTVNVSGASYYCTTAQGGGWAIPVPTDAAVRTVSFTELNINQNVDVTFPASTNAKADLKLAYTPPTITSSSSAVVGTPHTLNFNLVGGATSYKWNRWSATAAVAENCDSTANITPATTGTYSVLNTAVKQQGTAAFHLAIPDFKSQSFELNSLYYANASTSLSFQSQIGYADPTERFKVQVKEEGGTWVDVYNQAGMGDTRESVFTQRTVTLTAMVGKAFRVRFLQQYTSGSQSYGVTDYTGWFIDAINFTNVSTLSNPTLTSLATHSGSFTPSVAGNFLMSVTPVISNRDYPASYQTLNVTSGIPTPLTVSVTVAPASVLENGIPNLVYTFTRTGPTTSTLTASFSVQGNATLNTDYKQSGASTYTASAGTVIFAAGAATKTVTIDPSAETVIEPDETVILTVLAGASYAPGASSTATGTIVNDDTRVSVVVSPTSVSEDGSDNLVYTFTRTGAMSEALTVKFSIRGKAVNITDYTQSGAAIFSTTGSVIFEPGASTATVTLDPVADTTVEKNETATITLSSGTGYVVGFPSTATGTIINDDATVKVAVSPASTAENGIGNLVYTFTRAGATAGPLDVSFTVGGTATFESDYTQSGASSFLTSSGIVTFAPGATTAKVTLDPTADFTPEANETAILTIVPGVGYVGISQTSATGTITNDDTNISVTVSPASVTEDGINNLVYTFTRVGKTSGSLTAKFSVGGTATFSSDYTQTGAASYTATTGTVSFSSGVTQKIITLNPTPDTVAEADETAVLTVIAGTGYTPATPEVAIGTIANDEPAP